MKGRQSDEWIKIWLSKDSKILSVAEQSIKTKRKKWQEKMKKRRKIKEIDVGNK